MGGFGRFLRVNLTTREIKAAQAAPEDLRKFIGGRGLGAKILFDELAPKTDALSEKSVIVFANGPLTGLAPATGKIAVVFKSPLTSTIFDCEMGGNFGAVLGKAGFDGIIITGKANSPVRLEIADGKCEIRDAGELWGKTTGEVQAALQGETAAIGPAGENLVKFASLNHRHSAAGRGGLGAVMGSKKLKAITVRGSAEIPAANISEVRRYSKKLSDILMGHPVTGDSLKRFGTPVLVNLVNKFGLLPVNNFMYGKMEEAGDFSGETIAKSKKENKTCYACPMMCKRNIEYEGKAYKGPEYESLWALGPNCGSKSLKGIVEANELCNELGMDTISAGVVVGFAIDCFEKGKLKEKDVGFRLAWGDSDAILKLLRMIVERKGIGATLADGTRIAGEKLDARELAMNVKGLELPAYDPRGVKGQALSYATANKGGTHLHAYLVPQEIIGVPVYLDNLKYEGKPALVKRLQDISAMLDSLVICKFTTFAVFATLNFETDIYARLLTAATGYYFDEAEFNRAGERIFNIERLFNLREGLGMEDDSLPEKFAKEAMPGGPSSGQTVELGGMLAEYYKLRGWDAMGAPSERKLQSLELPYEEKWPKLQVALDLREPDEALRIAELSAKGGVDIIEAGTPLIKQCGLGIVTELKKRFPDKLIVADLKTMDTGYLETEMAAKAGADIVCILGTAEDATILDAVGAGKKFGIKVQVDLIAVPKERLVQRALEIEKMGADYICFHIGVDKQMRSDYEKIPFPILNEIASKVKIPISAAGGLKSGTIQQAIKSGAKILIIGGAITRAGDPEKATAALLKEAGR